MKNSEAQIKNILEKLYDRYNHRRLIKPDPLQFVYRYADRRDKEIIAFLAAALAYGRVQQIEKSLTDLFGRMGASPYAFVKNFDKLHRRKLSGFKHRFTTGEDISDLLELLRAVLNENGSIESYFLLGYHKDDENLISALSKFSEGLLTKYAGTYGKEASRGLKYLLSSPADGSACKRLNLFLRWMVRNDDVDPGLWKSIDKAKLVAPVDVHMGRLCRILGFHDRKTVSLSTAMKITKSFVAIMPADPVKYDFALSRIGILDGCTGRSSDKCGVCELFEYCLRRENRT